jgi:hypothetical protein
MNTIATMNIHGLRSKVKGLSSSTIAGLVLIPLGAWVALAPFLVGSWDGEFHFGRFLLALLPGGVAVLGGLLMLGGRRVLVLCGGAIAMAAGAWLIVGPAAYALFASNELGTGPGGESIRMLQWVGFFFGAGAFISLLSAYALGVLRPMRFSEKEWAEVMAPTGRVSQPEPARRPAPARTRERPHAARGRGLARRDA